MCAQSPTHTIKSAAVYDKSEISNIGIHCAYTFSGFEGKCYDAKCRRSSQLIL